ncbi:hypothetical protein EYF80_057115 [Liparis tanakae]|uniref:Uncharacterized protein n=1 Tax=Liparis tanakae TaxID=230148 RepID=A0A4Z2EWU8_9TELE|nr:hypothetical protein EYF80_057115 [Liparis tanakae]
MNGPDTPEPSVGFPVFPHSRPLAFNPSHLHHPASTSTPTSTPTSTSGRSQQAVSNGRKQASTRPRSSPRRRPGEGESPGRHRVTPGHREPRRGKSSRVEISQIQEQEAVDLATPSPTSGSGDNNSGDFISMNSPDPLRSAD